MSFTDYKPTDNDKTQMEHLRRIVTSMGQYKPHLMYIGEPAEAFMCEIDFANPEEKGAESHVSSISFTLATIGVTRESCIPSSVSVATKNVPVDQDTGVKEMFYLSLDQLDLTNLKAIVLIKSDLLGVLNAWLDRNDLKNVKLLVLSRLPPAVLSSSAFGTSIINYGVNAIFEHGEKKGMAMLEQSVQKMCEVYDKNDLMAIASMRRTM